MKEITAEWLAARRVCARDHAVFVAEWGDGAPLSRAGLVRAAELDLRITWMARELLPRDALDGHPAHHTYRERCHAHNASFRSAIDQAGADMRARLAGATDQAERDAASADYLAASKVIHDDHQTRREAFHAEWLAATAPSRIDLYTRQAHSLADVLGLP